MTEEEELKTEVRGGVGCILLNRQSPGSCSSEFFMLVKSLHNWISSTDPKSLTAWASGWSERWQRQWKSGIRRTVGSKWSLCGVQAGLPFDDDAGVDDHDHGDDLQAEHSAVEGTWCRYTMGTRSSRSISLNKLATAFQFAAEIQNNKDVLQCV